MKKYKLRDIDNRNDDGSPYEITGTLKALVGYIDGPVRGDLRDDSVADIDGIVATMRRGEVPNEIALNEIGIDIWPCESPATGRSMKWAP